MNHGLAILYATSEGQTQKIADHIAERFREDGYEVDIFMAKQLPRDFDLLAHQGVIIGAPVHMGEYPGHIKQLVRRHRSDLQGMPSAFFSVSLTEAEEDEMQRQEIQQLINRFLGDVQWQPTVIASFAGAVPFSRYGFIKKLIMRSIIRRRMGEVDTSKDYEYTDWVSVDEFVDQFDSHLAVARAASGSNRPSAPR